MKQKFAALKRNFESISHYASKDHQEMVGVQKEKKAFEDAITKLKQEKAVLEEALVNADKNGEANVQKIKTMEATIAQGVRDLQKSQVELSREKKIAEQKIAQYEQSNKMLSENNLKLKQ